MKKYDHKKIEKKWQNYWAKKKFYQASDKADAGEKFYALVEFPFPSGAGLHTGHIRSYTAMDIISRKKRAEGKNVLFPIGWDAFGLPTENYAIKTGIQPQKATKQNTDNFRKQLKSLGISFDWSREVDTTDPKYYKWTQWIFLQMYKKGLAYKAKTMVNWCPKDKTGLANEEVVNGCCERCGTPVEKREKEQWMLAITKYADRLDKDLDTVDYWEKIKIQQRNWIGKSEGAELAFNIDGSSEKIEVFTTRIDTLFGVTYLVVAPEHPLIDNLKDKIQNLKEVRAYAEAAKKKPDMDRTAEGKEKTGVELKGVTAVNPVNGEKLPVWIADYVLASYGTGAIMAVPGHDSRDHEFAKKYNLPIRNVIEAKYVNTSGEAAFRQGEEFVKRNVICAVVRNPKTDKYLCISWKKAHMNGLVTGGIDEGEKPSDAAIREVREETGYKNLRVLDRPAYVLHSLFYHRMKNVNRWARFNYVFLELVDEEQDDIEQSEKDLHDIVWKSQKEMKDFFTVVEGKTIDALLSDPHYIYLGDGILCNSGKYNDLESEEARQKITKDVGGKLVTKYKLRDWVFSRQRYWGEPIPMIYCDTCGWQPVPEKDLPVKLPPVKKYEPTDNGESPLAHAASWLKVKCPTCKGNARRETDTMPNWAGSSWYYLRYVDTKNSKAFASQDKIKHWLPVDWYNGGMAHTTLHLLYSRFWHKFLYDIGAVNTAEPYQKRTSQGLVLAESGDKMSKSKGNVVNPDDLVALYGADTLRLYELFMGPFDQAIVWNTSNMIGSRRFVERVHAMAAKVKKTAMSVELESLVHRTIKKVGDDIDGLGFNTAISSMMILSNAMEKEAASTGSIPYFAYEALLKILAPFAPHVTDEIWAELGQKKSIHLEKWPEFDSKKLVSGNFKIVVQINSKVRAQFEIDTDEEVKVMEKAMSLPEIQAKLSGKKPEKTIYVKGKLVNLVIAA